MSSLSQLDRVAARRQANWAKYPNTDSTLTLELTAKLNELWAERRLNRARRRFGPTSEIARRARVEREIERLASTNGS